MSRNGRNIPNTTIWIITGNDHAVGQFITIIDDRYAGSPMDKQGEGYLYEYDQCFEISLNLINLRNKKEAYNDNIVIAACDAFFELNQEVLKPYYMAKLRAEIDQKLRFFYLPSQTIEKENAAINSARFGMHIKGMDTEQMANLTSGDYHTITQIRCKQ